MRRIILVAVTLLACLGLSAQYRQKPGDPVDYSRIRIPRDSISYPVVATMEFDCRTTFDYVNSWIGMSSDPAERDSVAKASKLTTTRALKINGELRMSRDISEEMIENAIQKAFLETGLNRPLLAKRIEQTGKYSQINYSSEQFAKDMASLLMTGAGFGLAGAESVTVVTDAMSVAGTAMAADDLISTIENGQELDVASTAVNGVSTLTFLTDILVRAADDGKIPASVMKKLLEGNKAALFEKAKAAAGNGASMLGNLMSVIGVYQIAQAADERDRQKWENRIAACAKWQIDSFYKWVNYYLDRLSAYADKCWIIVFEPSSQALPFDFRGEMCRVNWEIKGGALLKCVGAPRVYGPRRQAPEGEYCGVIDAVATYDLSRYGNKFVHTSTAMSDAVSKDSGELWEWGAKKFGRTSNDYLRMIANDLVNNPMHTCEKARSKASLKVKYHAPVYVKVNTIDQVDDAYAEPTMMPLSFVGTDSFDKTAVAASLGFTQDDLESTADIDFKINTTIKGVQYGAMKEKEMWSPVEIEESVKDNTYTISSRMGKNAKPDVQSMPVDEYLGSLEDHDSFYLLLPFSSFEVSFEKQLKPVPQKRPETFAEWEKAKGKLW
jgi:hypothetical protein